MKKLKVLSAFGTRPEAIKMAPVIKEMEKYDDIDSKVLVTAQHRQMLDSVLDLFDIKPDYDLDIMKHGQTIEDITSKVVYGVSDILKNMFSPDIMLVHGDTTTAFASALAGFYNKISVGHVEAGLRTDNIYSPFPEEMNRRLISQISTLNFAPTKNNENNLLKNSIPKDKIFVTGNTVIDALHMVVKKDYSFENKKLQNIDFDKKIILLTCHRRENWGKPMEDIFNAVEKLAKNNQDVLIIYPIHLNPNIRKIADNIFTAPNIILTEPLEYEEFSNLMAKSYFIMTDSGGIQEEAPSLGKPVLVLRTETERPEAVQAGTVKIVGVNGKNILSASEKLLKDKNFYNDMANAVNPYGDGKASERIVEKIRILG